MIGLEESATIFEGAVSAVSLRQQAIMKSADDAGLLGEKDARISGRVSSLLIDTAKRRTGIQSDSELIALALASLAVEDEFLATFDAVAGTVDPTLDLEF